jgi:hypothetical protein
MRLRAFVPLLSLGVVLGAAAAPASEAQLPPGVEFRVPKAPTVAAGDSGAFLAYELHVTNYTLGALLLKRVDVLNSSGQVLLSVADSALARNVARPGANVPPSERLQIGGGLRAAVYLWVPVDRNNPPDVIRHRITVQRSGADSVPQALEGARVAVSRDIAVIGPPLRGEWVAVNGPSNVSGHRRAAIPLNGVVAIAQRFAIDYLQVDEHGKTFTGDLAINENHFAEGKDALAVADGIVVETKDSIPENVPGQPLAVPTLVTVGGNRVVIDLGNGRFAFYAHLRPGSLRVRTGDRVTRGQVIGLVGNSGNSTESHLHFHLIDANVPGTSTLGAEGIPYAFETLEIVGRCQVGAGTCTRGSAFTMQRAMPMQNEIVRFPK